MNLAKKLNLVSKVKSGVSEYFFGTETLRDLRDLESFRREFFDDLEIEKEDPRSMRNLTISGKIFFNVNLLTSLGLYFLDNNNAFLCTALFNEYLRILNSDCIRRRISDVRRIDRKYARYLVGQEKSKDRKEKTCRETDITGEEWKKGTGYDISDEQ